MSSIAESERPQLRGDPHEVGRHVRGRAAAPGLVVIEASDPEAIACGIVADSGGELCSGLREAHRALTSRVAVLDEERAVARARLAVAVAKRLAPFDERADAVLIDRRHDLEVAAALGVDERQKLTHLRSQLDGFHLARREAKAANAALDAARAQLTIDLRAGVDPVAISRAFDGLVAAEADAAVAQRALDAARAVETSIRDEVELGVEAAVRAAAAARRDLADIEAQPHVLVVRAGLVCLLGAAALGAAALQLVSPIVGAGLACATLPPAVELLLCARRATLRRPVLAQELDRAEGRLFEATQLRLPELEAAQAARHEAERRRAEATRRRSMAASRWSRTIGPDVAGCDAAKATELTRDVARLARAAESATVTSERLRDELDRDLAAFGAPDGLDPSDAVAHVERLVAIHPIASSLLEFVAEAEQRCVQRRLLESLVGRSDLESLRTIAEGPAIPMRLPLVIVDDGDVVVLPSVIGLIRALSESDAISIVTEDPTRWEPARRPVGPA